MNLKNLSILIVDDDPDVLTAVRLLLRTTVKLVTTESNPANLLSLLAMQPYDIVLLDMNFNASINTGNEGLFWLQKIKKTYPDMAVIMITAYADIDLAIRSLKDGASDFVVKPWHNDKLIATIKDALFKSNNYKIPVINTINKNRIGNEIIGESAIMKEVFFKVEKISPTDANILILGENGTGKDLIAKAIHQQSLRALKPFVKVDVGALTETLFESELFGHKRGAFTDAKEDRIGLFESANGGTLFLDEIGNISLTQQAKLLTVLQNRHITKLGTNQTVPIDIRLICATNLPLNELANEARFRKDLIYRINTVEIIMPPLRKRDDDVLLMATHFAKLYSSKYFKVTMQFDNSAIQKLKQYNYPGNVRELQYTIERAIIMADDTILTAKDIIFSPLESVPINNIEQLDTNLGKLERNTILLVIDKHKGNISKAAKELGLTRTALYRRLDKYDI